MPNIFSKWSSKSLCAGKLLSPKPVSGNYLECLTKDLEEAELVRFVVAYVSLKGLKAIGLKNIARVLEHPQSFGVASLVCFTGYKPLMTLNQLLVESHQDDEPRLKYFIDPKGKAKDEPHLTLLHEKVVYIKLDQSRAVIYLGSHNWSAPALGGRPTTTHRNAEISLRIEVPFVDSDLEGKDHSLAAEVNRHMKHCWNYKTCRTVTVANKEVFKDWRSNNCDKQQKLEPLSENIAILAVNTSSAPDWNTLENVGLYFRSLVKPEEGEFLWTAQNDARLFVLVWSCIDDLKSRKFPILLIGSTTMKNASKRSSRIGTDTADVGEFKAALSDNQQKDEHAQGNPIPPLLQSKITDRRSLNTLISHVSPITEAPSRKTKGVNLSIAST